MQTDAKFDFKRRGQKESMPNFAVFGVDWQSVFGSHTPTFDAKNGIDWRSAFLDHF